MTRQRHAARRGVPTSITRRLVVAQTQPPGAGRAGEHRAGTGVEQRPVRTASTDGSGVADRVDAGKAADQLARRSQLANLRLVDAEVRQLVARDTPELALRPALHGNFGDCWCHPELPTDRACAQG